MFAYSLVRSELMPDITYIKVFVDYLDAIEPLDDAERGRLFTSLLEYARAKPRNFAGTNGSYSR